MSDLLAPLLAVLDNEVDTFWCFVGYMDMVVSMWHCCTHIYMSCIHHRDKPSLIPSPPPQLLSLAVWAMHYSYCKWEQSRASIGVLWNTYNIRQYSHTNEILLNTYFMCKYLVFPFISPSFYLHLWNFSYVPLSFLSATSLWAVTGGHEDKTKTAKSFAQRHWSRVLPISE